MKGLIHVHLEGEGVTCLVKILNIIYLCWSIILFYVLSMVIFILKPEVYFDETPEVECWNANSFTRWLERLKEKRWEYNWRKALVSLNLSWVKSSGLLPGCERVPASVYDGWLKDKLMASFPVQLRSSIIIPMDPVVGLCQRSEEHTSELQSQR